MRRILLVLTVAALMAAFLAFGSSGVAFAQDEPAVVADSITKEDCKGEGWKALAFKNQGECIEAATQDEQDMEFGAVFVFPALLLGGAALLRRNNRK